MAHVHRKLWRKKPPPSVLLDWSHPLAKSFAAVYALNEGGGLSVRDAARQVSCPLTNGTLSSSSLSFTATAGQRVVVSPAPVIGTSDYTLCALVRSTAAYVGFGRPILTERAASGNDVISLSMYSSAVAQQNTVFSTWRNDAGNLSQIAATTSLRDGKEHFVAVTKSGASLKIYVDWKLENSATANANNTFSNSDREVWIGADKGDATSLFSGDIIFAGVALSALSADHVVALSENPWQIFQPVRRIVYVDMGAGGQTFDLDSAWAMQKTDGAESAWACQGVTNRDAAWAIQKKQDEAAAWAIQKTTSADAAWAFVTPQTVTLDSAWDIDSPIEPARTPVPAGLERNKNSLFSTTERAEDGNVYDRRDN